MGWRDVGRRLVETVEQRAGQQIVPRERMQVLESAESDRRVMQRTLDWIGFRLWNFGGGGAPTATARMPLEMTHQARIDSARESFTAWANDPQAGQQSDLYGAFVLGRGVPQARAADDAVQDILDEAWRDSANRRVLTSYPRLLEKATDISIQSNVTFTITDDGMDGRARASMLSFEDVFDVVRHPRDRQRILYWKVLERPVRYDHEQGKNVPAGRPQVVYYEDHEAFSDEPYMLAQDADADFGVPRHLIRPGKVVHLAVNKTSEMAFGVPRMRRLVKWFVAYNEMLESTLNRMKAAASIYATATVRGNDRDIQRIASMATNRQPAFGGSQEAVLGQPPSGVVPGVPVPGMLTGNEGVKYDPMKIDAGTGDLAQAAPSMQGQLSSIWPRTYLGAEGGSLAGAQAMELPVLKFIEMEQELFCQPHRALADLAIKAAIRTGHLDEWREPTELEWEKIADAEANGRDVDGVEYDPQTGQVRRDLSFDVSLPSPLRRAMADIVTAATGVAQSIQTLNPQVDVVELARWLFATVLVDAFDVEDPQRIVDQVMPRRPAAAVAAEEEERRQQELEHATAEAEALAAAAAIANGGGDPRSTGPDGKRHPPDAPYGGRRRSEPPEKKRVREAARPLGQRVRRRRARDRAWEHDVAGVVRAHLDRMAA